MTDKFTPNHIAQLEKCFDDHPNEFVGAQAGSVKCIKEWLIAELIKPKTIWPKYLMIRDTGITHDEEGGRIYTTVGRGYEKHKYIDADLITSSEIPAWKRDKEMAIEFVKRIQLIWMEEGFNPEQYCKDTLAKLTGGDIHG